jgi:hypothetical protein
MTVIELFKHKLDVFDYNNLNDIATLILNSSVILKVEAKVELQFNEPFTS